MTDPTAPSGSPQRSSTPLVVASFLPLGFAIVLALVAPGFYEPLLDDRVNVFGAPALVPFAGALLLLLAFNFLVIGFVRSSFVQGLIFAVTTTAGVFLVILARPSLASPCARRRHRLTPGYDGPAPRWRNRQTRRS